MQPVPEARSWAEKVASRLWMLQTSFADDPSNARHEYLVEEIERSIKDIVESRRSEYLAALMERFPGPERIDAPISNRRKPKLRREARKKWRTN